VTLSTSDALALFAHHAPGVLVDRFRADRCLNATRVAVEVMKRFSLATEPVSVTATAMNGIYAERVKKMGREPTQQDVNEWAALGGWAVGIDLNGVENGKWAGHLVCVVGKEWLVDAAAGQFSRPEKQIPVPEVFVGQVTPRWHKGKEGANFEGPEGAVLCYRARVGEATWMKQPGWQASKENMQAAEEIVKRMKGGLS